MGEANIIDMEYEHEYCPECGIGLNNREISIGFCQNCKANWEPELINNDEEDDLEY